MFEATTKKELKTVIDTAPWPGSPFQLNGVWVSLAFHSKTINSPSFYSVQCGNSSVMFCSNKTELINYLYQKVIKNV